jgi:hypothetical protein
VLSATWRTAPPRPSSFINTPTRTAVLIVMPGHGYLMRHFATESGKSKGQFYTPAEVSRKGSTLTFQLL